MLIACLYNWFAFLNQFYVFRYNASAFLHIGAAAAV